MVTKDYTFKRPGWAGRFDQEGQYQDYQRTQYEVYDYPGRFKGAHGQNFARWQMDGWRNNAEVARGTSRSPEIWPGRRIALTGHPQANLNREWQVVASELHGEQPGKSAAWGEGAARRDGPCAARPAAVHSLPHLQQLPDEDACTGGRFRPRLESAF